MSKVTANLVKRSLKANTHAFVCESATLGACVTNSYYLCRVTPGSAVQGLLVSYNIDYTVPTVLSVNGTVTPTAGDTPTVDQLVPSSHGAELVRVMVAGRPALVETETKARTVLIPFQVGDDADNIVTVNRDYFDIIVDAGAVRWFASADDSALKPILGYSADDMLVGLLMPVRR